MDFPFQNDARETREPYSLIPQWYGTYKHVTIERVSENSYPFTFITPGINLSRQTDEQVSMHFFPFRFLPP